MSADLHCDFEYHLRKGHVWRVEVEVPIEPAGPDDVDFLQLSVDVVASTQNLAQYIVQELHPDCLSVCVSDDPLCSEG
tara:strand:- start:86 stop:319 length:234 start_codon:yes stop_codon:yes gene_type:complete